MRLHSAISPQCSKWAKSDERTPEELKQNLQEYVTDVCKRYDGQPHVRWMDVVNETVSRNGEWFGPREGNDRWENPWHQIGIDETHPLKPPAYIKMAFELANKHAPEQQRRRMSPVLLVPPRLKMDNQSFWESWPELIERSDEMPGRQFLQR